MDQILEQKIPTACSPTNRYQSYSVQLSTGVLDSPLKGEGAKPCYLADG